MVKAAPWIVQGGLDPEEPCGTLTFRGQNSVAPNFEVAIVCGYLVKSPSSASRLSDVSRLLCFPFLLRLENLPHFSRKCFCRERLLNQCYAWFQDPVMHDGVIRVPRHVQHLHLRKAGY